MKPPLYHLELILTLAAIAIVLGVIGFWVFSDPHPLLLVHPGRS